MIQSVKAPLNKMNVLLLLFFTVVPSSAQIPDCVFNIAARYFSKRHPLVVSRATVDNCKTELTFKRSLDVDHIEMSSKDWITDLYEKRDSPIRSFHFQDEDIEELAVTDATIGSYIIVSECASSEKILRNIGDQIARLRNSWEWNPRARFLILLTRPQTNDFKMLSRYAFSLLWVPRITNVIVLVQDSENMVVYTWFPYHAPGYCPEHTYTVLINQCVNGTLVHDVDLFPQKITKDHNNCSLTISTFEISPMVMMRGPKPEEIYFNEGMEVRIVREFARQLNQHIVYREPPPDGGRWGFKLDNGSWNGLTGAIARSYSDLAMACLWYRCHLVKENECSRPYLLDKVRWYVPCAIPYPRWSSITRVFKLSLWLCFLLSFILLSLVMWQVVKWSKKFSQNSIENQAYTDLIKCLINFWAIILEESASNNPPHVMSIRIVFFSWVLYTWAMNTVYQTFLTTFLIDPGLQHQISTEEEVLSSGISYGTETSVVSQYRVLSGNPYNKLVDCSNTVLCMNKISKGEGLAFLFSKYLTEYNITMMFMDSAGNPKICEVEDDFAHNFINMLVPKGSPLLKNYNRIILELMQAGIINQWWDEIKFTAILETASNFELPPGEYIVMTMQHLQSAFYFLILGIVLSLVVFLSEVLVRFKGSNQ